MYINLLINGFVSYLHINTRLTLLLPIGLLSSSFFLFESVLLFLQHHAHLCSLFSKLQPIFQDLPVLLLTPPPPWSTSLPTNPHSYSSLLNCYSCTNDSPHRHYFEFLTLTDILSHSLSLSLSLFLALSLSLLFPQML